MAKTTAQLRRLVHHHLFHSAPAVLFLLAVVLLIIALTGTAPAHRHAGSLMVIKAGPGSNARASDADSVIRLGLLGSCFFPSSPGSVRVCSPAGFFLPFNRTYEAVGDLAATDFLPIFIPDAAPLVLTWICLSVLPIPFFVAATLPVHWPKRFAAGRLRSRPFYTASLTLLCCAWVIGLTATLSMGSEADTFNAQYNFALESPVPLDLAVRGDLFYYASFALLFQVFAGLAMLVNQENAPTEESDMMDAMWNHHLGTGVQRRPAGVV